MGVRGVLGGYEGLYLGMCWWGRCCRSVRGVHEGGVRNVLGGFWKWEASEKAISRCAMTEWLVQCIAYRTSRAILVHNSDAHRRAAGSHRVEHGAALDDEVAFPLEPGSGWRGVLCSSNRPRLFGNKKCQQPNQNATSRLPGQFPGLRGRLPGKKDGLICRSRHGTRVRVEWGVLYHIGPR